VNSSSTKTAQTASTTHHSFKTPESGSAEPVSTQNTAHDEWHYVGFWPRAFGTGADALLVSAIVTPLLMVIYGPGYLTDGNLIQGTWHILLGILMPAAAALWFLFRFQATPGKMMIHSEIVDQDSGLKPRPYQFIIRYLTFSLISLPLFGLGCLWILWDKRRQGFHDKLARTVVLRRAEWEHKVGE